MWHSTTPQCYAPAKSITGTCPLQRLNCACNSIKSLQNSKSDNGFVKIRYRYTVNNNVTNPALEVWTGMKIMSVLIEYMFLMIRLQLELVDFSCSVLRNIACERDYIVCSFFVQGGWPWCLCRAGWVRVSSGAVKTSTEYMRIISEEKSAIHAIITQVQRLLN